MVIEFRRKCRKFIVIYYHREAFGTVLPYERFYNTERLAAARRSYYPCTPETVGYIHPSLAEFPLEIVSHRYIYTVLVLLQFLALLKTFVFEVKAVFPQSLLDELRDIVQCDMHQYHAGKRGCHIEYDIQWQRIEPRFHRTVEQPYRQHDKEQSAYQRI